MGNATSSTDALNSATADTLYYTNTTPLNSITAPTSNLSMNSHKITSVANPTSAQDAVTLDYLETNYYNKTTADGNYYADTTPLNSIVVPTGSVSLNS